LKFYAGEAHTLILFFQGVVLVIVLADGDLNTSRSLSQVGIDPALPVKSDCNVRAIARAFAIIRRTSG